MFTYTHNGTTYEVGTEGTTEKRAVAVHMRDLGLSNAEIGSAFGEVFGAPVTGGSAGNLVTGGLRDLGREAEITTTGGSRSGKRLPVVAETSVAGPILAGIDATLAAVETARAAVEDLGPVPGTEEWITTETARREAAVTRATEALTTFTADPSAHVEAANKARTDRAATVEAAVAETVRVARHNVEEAMKGLVALNKARLVDKATLEATTETVSAFLSETEVTEEEATV